MNLLSDYRSFDLNNDTSQSTIYAHQKMFKTSNVLISTVFDYL